MWVYFLQYARDLQHLRFAVHAAGAGLQVRLGPFSGATQRRVRAITPISQTLTDAVTDHVDEGTLVTDYPGVTSIACLE